MTILYSASQRGQLKMIVSDLLMLKENEDPCLRPNSNWRYVAFGPK